LKSRGRSGPSRKGTCPARHGIRQSSRLFFLSVHRGIFLPEHRVLNKVKRCPIHQTNKRTRYLCAAPSARGPLFVPFSHRVAPFATMAQNWSTVSTVRSRVTFRDPARQYYVDMTSAQDVQLGSLSTLYLTHLCALLSTYSSDRHNLPACPTSDVGECTSNGDQRSALQINARMGALWQ